jgi:hypothetical protein
LENLFYQGPWYDSATVGGFWDPRSSAQSVVSNDVFRLIAGRNLSPARRIFFAKTIQRNAKIGGGQKEADGGLLIQLRAPSRDFAVNEIERGPSA